MLHIRLDESRHVSFLDQKARAVFLELVLSCIISDRLVFRYTSDSIISTVNREYQEVTDVSQPLPSRMISDSSSHVRSVMFSARGVNAVSSIGCVAHSIFWEEYSKLSRSWYFEEINFLTREHGHTKAYIEWTLRNNFGARLVLFSDRDNGLLPLNARDYFLRVTLPNGTPYFYAA